MGSAVERVVQRPEDATGGAIRGKRRSSARKAVTGGGLGRGRTVKLAGSRVESELFERADTGNVEIVLPKGAGCKDGITEVDGLDDIVDGTAEFSQVVTIENEEVALLAAANQKVSDRAALLVDEDGGSAGAKIGVVGVERGLIEWCEIIGDREAACGAELYDAIAIVRATGVGIECSITGDKKEIARSIDSGCATTHPDASARIGKCADLIRRGIENGVGHGSERGSAEANHPSMIGVVVFVGGPGSINHAIGKNQARTLGFIARIEGDSTGERASASARNGNGRINVAGRDALAAVGDIDSVDTLEELRAGVDGFADDIKCVGGRVDHGSSRDADFGGDVSVAAANESTRSGGRHGRFSSGAAVGGVDQAYVPERCAGRGVRIECVEAFVLRGHEDDVVNRTREREIGDPERLGIDRAIGLAGEKFAEGGGVDAGSGEGKLVRVRAVARDVVVIGENSGKIGDPDGV